MESYIYIYRLSTKNYVHGLEVIHMLYFFPFFFFFLFFIYKINYLSLFFHVKNRLSKSGVGEEIPRLWGREIIAKEKGEPHKTGKEGH